MNSWCPHASGKLFATNVRSICASRRYYFGPSRLSEERIRDAIVAVLTCVEEEEGDDTPEDVAKEVLFLCLQTGANPTMSRDEMIDLARNVVRYEWYRRRGGQKLGVKSCILHSRECKMQDLTPTARSEWRAGWPGGLEVFVGEGELAVA